MHTKKVRWLVILSLLAAILLFITVYSIPSLLSWQSNFLGRSFFVIIFCFSLCLIRIMLGPKASDRAVAMNTLGILIVGFCAILSIYTGREWYLDIAIAWALQGFIGALALAKYLEDKGFDE